VILLLLVLQLSESAGVRKDTPGSYQKEIPRVIFLSKMEEKEEGAKGILFKSKQKHQIRLKLMGCENNSCENPSEQVLELE
jgi:hypothetical protein